jgi:outer membrane receptor protein involved in Fe transport
MKYGSQIQWHYKKYRLVITPRLVILFSCFIFSQLSLLGQVSDSVSSSYFLNEVVISATKTENFVRDIPTRINLISSYQVKSLPVEYTDEYLQYLPGVNVSRPFGIFSSKSTVTMRGLDGKEQGRVLVMIDGVPVNKADGGSVNWNLINTGEIERIEVVKGPGSSIYGGNAMGGSINIITRKPQKKISGLFGLQYGTYNTMGGRLALSGRANENLEKGFYWGINGHYLQSDGYITQSEADQAANPYIVKSNMKEWCGGVKLGYDFKPNKFIELDFITFNDRQGTGEKVYQPEGNTTDHDTYHLRGKYHGEKGNSDWNASLFYFSEDYKKVNEYMKDDYTLYDVLSERVDLGGLFSYSYKFPEHHKLTAGTDLKQGSVDAQDIYYTSTDIVDNRGKMNTLGLFAQDEMSYLNDKFKLIAALRYDYARYYDGAFIIETPSGETSFMTSYVDSAQTAFSWNAISPKLSLQYRFKGDNRLYISYARGFRPSVLDDLCRSGRVRGGFKIANNDLGPETLDNFELGGDVMLPYKIMFTASTYYSLGHDFIYYVNSGDSIDMGFGDRPIYMPENITGVNIFGVELELYYDVLPGLRLMTNYAHAHSEISDYEPRNPEDQADLTGKYLIDVPANMVSFTATWSNRIVNASLAVKYTGKRWVNDQNIYDEIVGSDQYPAYTTVDAKVWKDFRNFYLSLTAQNIFDVDYYDSKGSVCPGRFITMEAGVKF